MLTILFISLGTFIAGLVIGFRLGIQSFVWLGQREGWKVKDKRGLPVSLK